MDNIAGNPKGNWIIIKNNLFYSGVKYNDNYHYVSDQPELLYQFKHNRLQAKRFSHKRYAEQLANKLGGKVERYKPKRVKPVQYELKYTLQEISTDKLKLAESIRGYAAWKNTSLNNLLDTMGFARATVLNLENPNRTSWASFLAKVALKLYNMIKSDNI